MYVETREWSHYELKIKTLVTGSAVSLVWSGISEMRNPETVLTPFFNDLLKTLTGKSLIIDFRAFEFMSSATHAPILQFIKSLSQNQIQTRVIYNNSLEWQRVSFRCMKVLFRSMQQIQFECL